MQVYVELFSEGRFVQFLYFEYVVAILTLWIILDYFLVLRCCFLQSCLKME